MQVRKRLLLIALLGIWVGMADRDVSAASVPFHLCEEVCAASPACDEECWRNQWEFDNEYPPTTCGEEEYSCCGDGSCWPLYEGCNYCQEDCGTVEGCANECLTSEQCSTGYYCNARRECVRAPGVQGQPPSPTCGGSCTHDGQCCGNDQCVPYQGGKECAIRSTLICEEAQECETSNDCAVWAYNTCGEEHLAVFCDPGIDRCQFVWGPECPDENNVCG